MTPRCDTRLNQWLHCRTPLVEQRTTLGHVRWVCPRCTARAAGRCWQCSKPRTNHPEFGVYCDACRQAAQRESARRSRRSDEVREAQRRRWHEKRKHDPATLAYRRAYMKAWKARNPDKVKAGWDAWKAKKAAQQDGAA